MPRDNTDEMTSSNECKEDENERDSDTTAVAEYLGRRSSD